MIEASSPFQQVEIVRSPSPRLVGEFALVLQAIGVPHLRVEGPGYLSLVVSAADAERAMEELANYQRENKAWPPARPVIRPMGGGSRSAWIIAAFMAGMFRLAQVHAFGFDWDAAGRVDGARVRAGEVWRGVTALTLHSDIAHLVSNLIFGALFGVLVCQVHGPGLGWLAILLAGVAGNLANTWVQGFDNLSLGSSTAVFGALGVLGATQWAAKLRLGHGLLARWAPLLAAAMLLGWHGMGSAHIDPARGVVRDPSDRTDIGAHVFGFLAGLALGALLARLRRDGEPGPLARRIAGVATVVILALAWALALWAARA